MTAWQGFDEICTHPGYGLDPQTVVRIFRAAELGLLWQQADLFDDVIESDGHLASLIHSRTDAVAGKEWVLQPGAQDDVSIEAANLLERQLRDSLNFYDTIEHQLSAPYFGYAASEIMWELIDGLVLPAWFDAVPHRRFVAKGRELRLMTKEQTLDGEILIPGKWMISQRRGYNVARAGLLRVAAWWALFKRMSVRDWIVFAEKFGIPHVVGVYEDRASPEARAALELALQNIGEAGQVIISETCKIVFSDHGQRSGDTSQVHPAIVAMCEAQMSKLINGATQNVEQGAAGSYAQARVHQARSFALELADAMRLSHVFRQHVGVPFMKYNGFPATAAAPRLKVQLVPELDPKTRAEVASILANELGAELDRQQIFDELGFRTPERSGDALRGTKKPEKEAKGPADA